VNGRELATPPHLVINLFAWFTWPQLVTGTHMQRYLLLVSLMLLAGCVNLPRYTAAEPRLVGELPSTSSLTMAVLFEPVFEGKPVSETVVDNALGAYWSPAEAGQIGFTQKYGETLADRGPQLAMLAAMPASTRAGFAASGQSGGFNISSRIMVPAGLFITRNTASLLGSATRKSVVCEDSACIDKARDALTYDRLAIVRIQKLRVAEERANHLTLEVVARVEVSDAEGPRTARIVRANISDRSIASEGLFHSDFLKAMNKMASELGSDFAAQVLAAARSP